MTFIIVGLGNPGEEYAETRHNAGRMAVEAFIKTNDLPEAEPDKTKKSLVSKGKAGKVPVIVAEPETFMNNSGEAVKKFVASKKAAENLIVAHDDLDLPIGSIKISFDRGAGGHHGVESIIKAVGTTAFTRVRIGIAPETPSGKVKKPQGEKKVLDFIIKSFGEAELKEMKKAAKAAAEAMTMIVSEGREKAMGEWNGR